MGPLRGRLIAGSSVLASFFSVPALAEVCDKVRPNWDGTPVNMVDEAIGQLSNPFTALVIVASIILVLQKSWLLTVLGVIMVAMNALLFFDPAFLDDVAWQANREGCIGDQELWYALVAGIGVFGLLRLARKSVRVLG